MIHVQRRKVQNGYREIQKGSLQNAKKRVANTQQAKPTREFNMRIHQAEQDYQLSEPATMPSACC